MNLSKVSTTLVLATLTLLAPGLVGRLWGDSLEEGLMVWLPLTDDLRDHSVQQHLVKVVGGVKLEQRAATFPGDGSWLELPHLSFNRSAFTISMWIQAAGSAPMYGLLEQRAENARNRHFHLMLRSSLQPYLGFYLNDVLSPRGISAGAWTHLVFQYDGTRQKIWVNGQLLCERKASAYAGGSGATRLGKSPNWTNVRAQHFQGQMRDVRFYNRAVSGEGLLRLFQTGAAFSPGVIPASGTAGAGPVGSVVLPAARETSAKLPSASAFAPFLSIDGSRLMITGAAGQIYEVQATSNLLGAWEPIGTVTNTTGLLQVLDSGAARFRERFYRILVK